ncbi:DNA cytosine methyltransferase [Micromonospora chalcea]|uniref:DNA cytosine methyltransferase n=1 Tax=Micromonospora chalcea TaxID=1874 RepID=UPI0021A6CD5C|nr:DNA cytosine methyltransferase [Micromonospora chalcea]MCT2280703.1 DNA cytosine methyltransferase [Micromonospora chalcea]
MVEESAGAAQPAIRAAEFFAGIGLVREALEPLGVEVVWANDIEPAKRAAYAANHNAEHFQLGDIRNISASDLSATVELATSSFPCVDLSLAGNRRGLVGAQSGMFWEFARIIDEMQERRPRVVLLENVHGFATSHGGKDLADALARLSELGYSCDVFAVDARHFVPQSRPRMFIVGIRGALPPGARTGIPPLSKTRPAWVQRVHARHQDLGMHYLPLPELPDGPQDLSSVVERMDQSDPRWWSHDRVAAFVHSLSQVQTARMESLRDARRLSWRTAYRRTRNGVAVWELRRDAIGGCLRTTGGGSSKQALVELGKGEVRVRWMTPLEYARMMGAGSYKLSGGTPNQALFGFGDAVVVDVVRWIGQHYLLPALHWQMLPQAA